MLIRNWYVMPLRFCLYVVSNNAQFNIKKSGTQAIRVDSVIVSLNVCRKDVLVSRCGTQMVQADGAVGGFAIPGAETEAIGA